jgi:hypothetical protein
MKYANEMGLDAMIYIPSFIKVGLGIRKLMGGESWDTETHRRHGDRVNQLLFFQNKKNRLRTKSESSSHINEH